MQSHLSSSSQESQTTELAGEICKGLLGKRRKTVLIAAKSRLPSGYSCGTHTLRAIYSFQVSIPRTANSSGTFAGSWPLAQHPSLQLCQEAFLSAPCFVSTTN